MDILIQEQFSGGDLIYRNYDLANSSVYDNMIYLSLFGGDDWFMNELLPAGDDKGVRFTGTTERLCRETVLNSAGRVIIEDGARADLQHLLDNIPGSTLAVSVAIISDDAIKINITFRGVLYTYTWYAGATTGSRIHGDEFGDEFD